MGRTDCFRGHTKSVHCLAFSPDSRLAATGGADGTVRLWDVGTGSELRKLTGHTEPVNAVCFSRDGRTVLSGGADHSVRLWDAATGKAVGTLNGHDAAVMALAVSSDGRWLASGAFDGKVVLWDYAKKRAVVASRQEGRVFCLAFGADSAALAVGYWGPRQDAGVRLCRMDTKQEATISFRDTLAIPVALLATTDGGFLCSTDDGQLYKLPLKGGEPESVYKYDGAVGSLAAVPDSDRLVLGGLSGAAVVDWKLGKVIRRFPAPNDHLVRWVAVTPDAKLLGTVSGDPTSENGPGVIQLYVLETGAPYIPGNRGDGR